MRKILQGAGFVVALVGVSGTIDRLFYQPIFGFLNVFNRFVVPRLDFLDGYELFANIMVAVLGVAVLLAAARGEES